LEGISHESRAHLTIDYVICSLHALFSWVLQEGF
jgi:hypothetical protein